MEPLHQRSDGYWETSDGFFACIMVVKTACRAEHCFFRYKTAVNNDSITVEWLAQHKLQLFPGNIVRGLLDRGWAVPPTTEAIEWFNENFAANPDAVKGKSDEDDKKAKEPAKADKKAPAEADEKKEPAKADTSKARADAATADQAATGDKTKPAENPWESSDTKKGAEK